MCTFNRVKNATLFFAVLVLRIVVCVDCSRGQSDDRIRVSVNDYERTRMLAQMWVEPEKLDFSQAPLAPDNEAQFRQIWRDVGEEASKVEAAWDRAIEADPLIARALDCLNRSNDLTVPYNMLRNSMRTQHGRVALAEFEKEGGVWLQSCGMQWVDLNDRQLLLLFIRCRAIMDSVAEKNEKDDDEASSAWRAMSGPGVEFMQRSDDVSSEEDAVNFLRRGLQSHREKHQAERDRLRQNAKAPDELWAYLQIRQESDYLGSIGETYLKVRLPGEHKYIATAEEQFTRRFAQLERFPNVMKALYAVHRSRMELDVERLKKLHEELLSP